MRYPELIFDLYGTLVDIHTEEGPAVWDKTALFYGFYGADYTGKTLHAAYAAQTAASEAAVGQKYECFPELQIETVFTGLFRQKGVTRNAGTLGVQAAQLFRVLSIEYLRLYPGVRDALAALRADGHRLWLLTNAQRVFTACELRLLGLEDCFDGIYISSDYGVRKPDARFFEVLLREQRLRPEQCLMIGNDRSTDIAGARAAGMAGLYLHTNLSPAEDRQPPTAGRPAPDYIHDGTDWAQTLQAIRSACGQTAE